MKKTIIYILILALSTQAFSRMFVLMEYKLRYNYIVTHLCENRNAPQKHCNGKCYLMKQMKKSEKRDDIPGSYQTEDLDQLFYSDHNTFSWCVIKYDVVKINVTQTTHQSSTILFSVFHPPQA